MFRIFREVRRKLTESNRIRSYIFYAVGEIFLVVIGILIALQINNWNQDRIDRNKEEKILANFKEVLEDDLIEMEEALIFYQRSINSIEIILEHFNEDKPYHDSLAAHFFNTTLIWEGTDFNDGVYETLKSVGIDLISDDDLRKAIVFLYDENDYWIHRWETRYIDMIMDARDEIFMPRFNEFWKGDYRDLYVEGSMRPIDYESLKNDHEYLFFIKSLKNQIDWLIKKPLEIVIQDTQKVLEKIDRQL